jgi:hypothetical protein
LRGGTHARTTRLARTGHGGHDSSTAPHACAVLENSRVSTKGRARVVTHIRGYLDKVLHDRLRVGLGGRRSSATNFAAVGAVPFLDTTLIKMPGLGQARVKCELAWGKGMQGGGPESGGGVMNACL